MDVIIEIIDPENMIVKYLLNLFPSKKPIISDLLDTIDEVATKKNKFDEIIA
ncbi:hypothetical protein [Clostridium beijerinckii]|uniref:hypothetical protein n=1 Tax=Clostridium beijerinckii TaxID=1520 RepID=UPI0015C31D8A|nr:hypothetical protein [Clostridium beijerinckii]